MGAGSMRKACRRVQTCSGSASSRSDERSHDDEQDRRPRKGIAHLGEPEGEALMTRFSSFTGTRRSAGPLLVGVMTGLTRMSRTASNSGDERALRRAINVVSVPNGILVSEMR